MDFARNIDKLNLANLEGEVMGEKIIDRLTHKGTDVTFQAAIYPCSQVLLGVLIGLILIF